MSANKTVLITGASGGLGYEFAKIFAKNRYNLVLIARNKEKLVAIQKELEKTYTISVTIIPADLAHADAARDIYSTLKGNVIDVLVNNAGFATHGAFAQIPFQEDLDEMQVNMVTVTSLTKFLIPDMVKRRDGKILNVASTAAFQPGPFMAVYYATKAYVLSFSEALSEELRGTGVTVTTLCPGPMHTGFVKRAHMGNTRLFKYGNIMSAESVAAAGYKGVMNGKRVIIPGFLNQLGVIIFRFLPHTFALQTIRKLH